MARGGYRPGAGRPRKDGSAPKGAAPKETIQNIPADIKKAARSVRMTPLEYMLAVINSEDADPVRRDRMAAAAAPYVQVKASDEKQATRKEERQANAESKMTAENKFAAPAPPAGLMN